MRLNCRCINVYTPEIPLSFKPDWDSLAAIIC